MTDIKEQDKLDDKELKAKENAEQKGKEEKKEDKSLSEEERKIADKAADKKISKEDARKEVARETVKEETGYSADALADVGKKVMHAGESADKKGDATKAAARMSEIKGGAVEGMLEKMVDSKVANKIVQAGLGSEFTSTGASGLEQSARTVLEEIKKYGGENGMENMLTTAALNGTLTLDQIRQLTPEKLKETLDVMKSGEKTPDKGDRAFPQTRKDGIEGITASKGQEYPVTVPQLPDKYTKSAPTHETTTPTLPIRGRESR